MALEPITRQEKIIAGEDIKPVTRLEHFLKNYGGGSGGSSGGGVSLYEHHVTVMGTCSMPFPADAGKDGNVYCRLNIIATSADPVTDFETLVDTFVESGKINFCGHGTVSVYQEGARPNDYPITYAALHRNYDSFLGRTNRTIYVGAIGHNSSGNVYLEELSMTVYSVTSVSDTVRQIC